MSPEENINKQLSVLKDHLLALKATGTDGFEGFIRVILTKLTNIPFRLAASGFQGGVDGNAALQSDAVCFEAKRYTGDIHRNDILTKIVDLARNKDAPDRLWVLGATTEISKQLASDVQETGDQHAISTLVLDWTAAPLPLLAIATVAAGDKSVEFLTNHSSPKPNRKKLFKIFEEILKHPNFESLLQRLLSDLNISKLATARAVAINKEWRKKSFGSENTARERLGQALAINANSVLPSLRLAQREQIKKFLLNNSSIILTGAEGHGKSWLAAQICFDHGGIALFTSAEQFDSVAPNELNEHIISLLIKQTGDFANDAIKQRWHHRISAWERQPTAFPLLIIVDGINQRQKIRWDRILNGLQEKLQVIGGRLIVTVRPQFWHKIVMPGLNFEPKKIEVLEWMSEERNQLLQHYGINLDWLDSATLKTLSNPRLLGIAVARLPHENSKSWKGLTPDRVLLEHLRASQRENFEEETLSSLTKRLSLHAKEVLAKVRSSSNEAPQNFISESEAVIETRFFQTLPGPSDVYVLRDEGLTLALGYTLTDQLWQAQISNLDLGEQIAHLIDPIYAMDRTVDVIFAALMICALDQTRFNQNIFSAFLNAFSNLQNVDSQRFEHFVEIVKNQPIDFFSSLGAFTLEGGRRLNQDWFIHTAFEIAATSEGWPVAKAAIHQWLHCYNKDAVEQTNRYPKRDENEDIRRLQERMKEIQDTLSSLSSFENNLLKQMKEVTGETGDLFTLALKLLAKHPLAEFANSFVALGLGFSLDRGTGSAQNAFQQLTTFNNCDREEAKKAYLKSIEPLRTVETSRASQWTIVRMLHATGDEAFVHEAEAITQNLRAPPLSWAKISPNGWQKISIADPNAKRPIDIDEGLNHFCELQPDSILTSFSYRIEDSDLQSFLPVACRFEKKVAVEKARQILSGLLTRTAFPLRQLTLNGAEYTPLMTRVLAKKLVNRMTKNFTSTIKTLPEREQDVIRRFLFSYAIQKLTPEEQLECMTSSDFGSNYLLDIIPSIKHQKPENIINALQNALHTKSEEKAYSALAATLYGETPITSELEQLLLQCYKTQSLKLRALVFEITIRNNLTKIRKAHSKSNWSANQKANSPYESWYDSILLAEACAKNEITIDEVLNRTAPETWFSSAKRIGTKIHYSLANHFLKRLENAVAEIINFEPPPLSFIYSKTDPIPYHLRPIEKRETSERHFSRSEIFEEMFKIDNDDFYEKQDRINSTSEDFFHKLQNSSILIFFEYIAIDDLKLIIHSSPTSLSRIIKILEKASNTELFWLKNLALITANIISKDMPEKAATIFQKTLKTQDFITYSFGDDMKLEHEAIWSSAPSEIMNSLWRQRLLSSCNDEVLAREVTAAERFGAAAFIKDFVNKHANSTSTLYKAYAITIAGFSKHSLQFLNVIEKHLDDKGITGDAAKEAKAAHDAAQWSTKWVIDMSIAKTQEEFWRCLIISKTCMDARTPNDSLAGTEWTHYVPLFRRIRKAALKEQNKSRQKKLIGQDAPKEIFITGYR
ncbi:hypothetical protein PSCICJ_41610 [Pseudomonas cichorii]|uniref:hypothetical protein n=1 Tax=Pseudomonas cichorii TaxID=36746 RepID=UPI0019100822|nr:hypothetical protein [Pseudomonas cichorii]GFM68043.1 hypothetical protein PSCICJ_41610 [Pseudomonas cichorii]